MNKLKLFQQLKKLNRKLSIQHKELIRTLDGIELQSLPNSQMVGIDLIQFEKIANLASSMYESDRFQNKILNNISLINVSHQNKVMKAKQKIKNLKQQTEIVKISFRLQSEEIYREIRHVNSILKEYRERCRADMIEYLTNQDLLLRKVLKPLVPSNVLDEHISFTKINIEPSVLSSLAATQQEIQNNEGWESNASSPRSEDPEQRMNTHLNMLVSTLEQVAKNLIGMLNDVNRKYYEYVDPKEIQSDPPTPLAAPLPEYFSYEAKDLDNGDQEFDQIIDETAKLKLLKKLIECQNQSIKGVITPNKAGDLRQRLEKLLYSQVTKVQLQEIFTQARISVKESEELVYDLIDTDRHEYKDVTLDEILGNQPQEQVRIINSISSSTSQQTQKSIEKKEKRMQLPQEIPYRNLTPGLGPKTAPSSKAKDNVRKRRQNSNNSMIKNPSKIQKPVMQGKKASIDLKSRAVTPSNRRKHSPARNGPWLKRRKSIGK